MTTTRPKRGDIVRLVFEGPYLGIIGAPDEPASDKFDDPSGGLPWFLAKTDRLVSVEILPPPAPVWAEGDAVQCQHGYNYIRHNDGWTNAYGSQLRTLGECQDRLTRLIPEDAA